MLITIDSEFLNIWMYKDCYLRFSSQEFNIENLKESIHLTNNAIQKLCKNQLNRDFRLPAQNMWSLKQFRLYLKKLGHPESLWDYKIYTGFKENLTAVVMTSMNEMEFVKNSFKLYGCDFMLDENFTPILIEINAAPDLRCTTGVTTTICPKVQEDLIKVIVDKNDNTQAATGEFELIQKIGHQIKGDNLNESAEIFEIKGNKIMSRN